MTTTTETAPIVTETAAEEFDRLTAIPVAERTAVQNKRVRSLARKIAPATATTTTEEKSTATPKTAKADAKAAEAAKSDQQLVTHTREAEVAALIERGWSKAALTRQPEVAGTTAMWRLGRLTAVDVLKIDALLKRIDTEKVEPPTRKVATGGATRTAGPSRTVLIARVAAAESRLDASASAKTVKELREAIVASLEILRGDQPQSQDS